jgi:hypothetical protein
MNGLMTSIQDPHAPVMSPPDSPSPAESSKVSDDAELKQALKLIESAKAARKDIDKDWTKYEAYYDGNQWYGRNRPAYRASPVANKIRPAIQTMLPIMTDAQPGIDVSPQEPSDYTFATSIADVARAWWTKRNVSLTLNEMVLDALKLSGGIGKVVWDADLDNGRGDVRVLRVDPRNFYPADGATDCNVNCPYTVEMYPARVGELKRRYPEKAKQIRSTGPRDKQKKDASGTGVNTEILLVSPIDKGTGPFPEGAAGGAGSSNDNDVAWVAEIWMDDYATEEVTSDDGTVEQRRKYPNGKIVQCIPDLNLLLAVDDNPYRDGLKPYVRIIDTIVPGQFWGEGEVGPYIAVQDMINRTLATIYDSLNSMSNPVWILDAESGVDPNMITNQIGLILVKNRGTEVRREPPPPLPAQVFEFYSMMSSEFDSQSGVHDITQGRKPVGVTAAEAMNTMQEAAQTRIRLKERNMQAALNSMGYLIISRILQFYRKPRIVRITGKDNIPEYFEFFIEDAPNGGMKFNKRQFDYDETGKKYTPAQRGWQVAGESKGMFDISIVAGTSLPAMKAQRGNLALRLADGKYIDQESLLDVLEWPNKEEIMSRMQQQMQAAADAQQGAAGGKGVPQ